MAVLDEIQNQGSGNEPNISDINSYYPEGFTPPANNESQGSPFTKGMDLSGQETSPGAMSFEDYYPVFANPYTGNINKGSYSGSIVGNIPIFVDSNLPSIAPYHAREQALQKAAANKAAEIKKLQDDLVKVPQLKNAPDQPEMNDIYLNGINKWKQMYNGDVKSMSQDPKFQKWQEDVRTAGRINDAAYEQYAQMGKEMDDGKKYFSPETKESYRKFMSGAAKLGDPASPDAQNFTAKAFKLNQSYDLDLAVDDGLKSYHPTVTTTDPQKIGTGGIYDILQSTKTTGSEEEIIALAKDVYKSKFEGTGTFTEQDVIDRFLHAYRIKVEKKYSTPTNRFAPRAEKSAATEAYNYNQKETARDVSLYGGRNPNSAENVSKTSLSSVYKLSASDQSKKLDIPVDIKNMRAIDGTPLKPGNIQGTISDIAVAKVFKNGVKIGASKVDEKGVKRAIQKDMGGMLVDETVDEEYRNNPALFEFKPVAMLNETDKGKESKTIVVPLHYIANHFQNPNKKPGQLDLTDMAEDVTKDAKIMENQRLSKVMDYVNSQKQNTGKKVSPEQKKSVSSGSKSNSTGKIKPVGNL